MAPNTLTTVAAVALGLACTVSAALDPIIIDGNHFFFKTNGSEFYLKGVAYQSDAGSAQVKSSNGYVEPTNYTDPLADVDACTRDIKYIAGLGANVIRTYSLDPTQNHDQCMQALDDAGIYLVTDLAQPQASINRNDPQWNTELYERYTSVIDAMAKYDNVIGFFAGNEVANSLNNTNATAFVKAAVRDMKAYIKQKNYRAMGVGYAADDDATVRANVAAYMNCGTSETSIDFWGYNIYSWCGQSSFEQSGYQTRTQAFANYSVPVFFAEFGCNQIPGGGAARTFDDIPVLFGPQMDNVFAGGIVYEYFQNANDYGLVNLTGNDITTLDSYNALSSRYASVSPTSSNTASYTPSNTVLQSCPAVQTGTWEAAASPLPPTPNQAVCDCMVSTLQCVAVPNISDEDIGTLFGQICGYDNGSACKGIDADPVTGNYGAYSMCNATEQLSNVMNAYYMGAGQKASDACSFGGSATLLASAPGAASTCSSVISAATNSANQGGSSGNSGSASKKSDATTISQPVLGMGKYFGAVYVSTLLLSLGGMLLL